MFCADSSRTTARTHGTGSRVLVQRKIMDEERDTMVTEGATGSGRRRDCVGNEDAEVVCTGSRSRESHVQAVFGVRRLLGCLHRLL